MTIRARVGLVLMTLAAAGAMRYVSAQALVSQTMTGPPPPQGLQAPEPTTGTGLILGRVVDMGNGKPVASAIVTLGGTSLGQSTTSFGGGPTVTRVVPSPIGTGGSTLSVLSDSEGRFVFRDLPKGSFAFAVSAVGYVGGGYGQKRPTATIQQSFQSLDLADGQKMGGVTLPLWKLGAIGGTITDESGEPIVGVDVTIFQRATVAGHLRIGAAVQHARTDDRGIYRASWLVPGDYVASVPVTQITAPLAGNTSSRGAPGSFPLGTPNSIQIGAAIRTLRTGVVSPEPSPDGRELVYQSVFYPSAHAPADAGIITLTSGEEHTGVNMQLRLGRAVRIEGHIVGPKGPVAAIAVHLVSIGASELSTESGVDAGTTTTDATGGFTFLGISAGRYTLRAVLPPPAVDSPNSITTTSGRGSFTTTFGGGSTPMPTELPYWISQPVDVEDHDVADLSLVLRAGARLTGHARFDGNKPPPDNNALTSIGVSLEPADGRRTTTDIQLQMRGEFDASGAFTTVGLPAGRYLLRASSAPPGWVFKSATYEGRDVSVSPIDVEGGDINGIDIIFTDRVISLSGVVRNGDGPDAGATVVLFPSDSSLWLDFGRSPRRLKMTRASKSGTYSISGVPEGDYFLAAIPDETAEDVLEPKALESLRTRATRVSLADGDKKTLDLRTIK